MLDLKHLKTLREVARRGSFAAAAESLSVAPSAVSQQMANLEQDVGAILFERSQRGNRLSESGRALVHRAEAILVAVAEAEAELDAISDPAGRKPAPRVLHERHGRLRRARGRTSREQVPGRRAVVRGR